MGVCQSGRRHTKTSSLHHEAPSQKKQSYKINQPRLKVILSDFAIFQDFSQMLDGVAYTQNEAIDLSKTLIDGIVAIQKHETAKEKDSVLQLFNHDTISKIKNQQLYYFEMLHKLKKNEKVISQSCKSRIYHTIANLKKDKNVQKKSMNRYNIDWIKNNNYKELSESGMEQIIKYETIAHYIQQMAVKMNFKFSSISKESQKVYKFLSQVFVQNIGQINRLAYNLSDNEVIKMADISMQACSYSEYGFFPLIVYFIESFKQLQKDGKNSQEIEQILNHALERISKKYPTEQGFTKEPYQLIEKLKILQNQNMYNKIDFSEEQVTLKSTHKQDQVEEIIKKYAKNAAENKDFFQELIKQTCLQRCTDFKVNLKYHPKTHNRIALTHIKQKMILTSIIPEVQKNMKGTIEEIMMRQQMAFRKTIDQSLEKSNKVSFKINDMLVGRCVFLKLSDILETINLIKKFIKKDNRFALKSVESRFIYTNTSSDVALKIVINNQIIAQLQLTTQSNEKIFNFSHQINQLQRSKLFSKIKAVRNYYEEFNDTFSQLTSQILNLQIYRSSFQQEDKVIINQFFKLDAVKYKHFLQILQENFQQKKGQTHHLAVVIDPMLQDLMLGVFQISIGRWYKSLGHTINHALDSDQLSPRLKSVLLSYFLEAFQLTKEAECMHQFSLPSQQTKQKVYIEEYIKEYFQIEKVLKYSYENQRIFHRAQQLKQILFTYPSYNEPAQLQESSFVINSVIQQHSQQNIEKLKQLLNFYFVTRKGEDETLYDNFAYYYNWINTQCQLVKDINTQQLKSQIAILKVQQLLETNKPQQAIKLIEKALKVFQAKEQQQKVIQCEILQTQCSIRISKRRLQEYIKEYDQKVVKKAQMFGLQLKGALYADSLWRISQHLWERTKQHEKKLLLETFTKMALQQMSQSKGKQFIYALCKRWEQFSLRGVKQPQIKNNQNIKYVNLADIGRMGCFYLSVTAKWQNLTKLKLRGSSIGVQGSEYLSRSKWEKLTYLDLFHNELGATGCEHIIKANWKNLTYLNLGSNNIGSAGCEHLSKSSWENLTHLDLTSNNIGPSGCEFLARAKWDKLAQFDLYNNGIEAQGCLILSRANWENLIRLDLYFNNIKDAGCEFISKAKWQKLTVLNLSQNNISDFIAARARFHHRPSFKLLL